MAGRQLRNDAEEDSAIDEAPLHGSWELIPSAALSRRELNPISQHTTYVDRMDGSLNNQRL